MVSKSWLLCGRRIINFHYIRKCGKFMEATMIRRRTPSTINDTNNQSPMAFETGKLCHELWISLSAINAVNGIRDGSCFYFLCAWQEIHFEVSKYSVKIIIRPNPSIYSKHMKLYSSDDSDTSCACTRWMHNDDGISAVLPLTQIFRTDIFPKIIIIVFAQTGRA